MSEALRCCMCTVQATPFKCICLFCKSRIVLLASSTHFHCTFQNVTEQHLMLETEFTVIHILFCFRALFQIMGAFGRLQFYILGFFWIKSTGRRASRSEAPILVFAPHSSYFDSLLWFASFPVPSPVSRLENASTPLIGSKQLTVSYLVIKYC